MIQKAKGTYDVVGGKDILYVEQLIKTLMENYNYEYFRTPIFEASELFHRGVGETTDIVTKETYDFIDRGNRSMTLRPEGTAGVVRSYIENKLYGSHTMPVKSWYYGPMFRYERPQSGRFREFYQFGVEVFGSDDPMSDAEVISIPVTLYKLLGLKNIKVKVNSLGDVESRTKYKEALQNYFKPYLKDLCEDCNNRFNKNPLRILDCKVDGDLDMMKNAPKMEDYLTVESKAYFEKVKNYLEILEIPYEVDPNLVRGLDYYTHTVFEVYADVLKVSSALCGGGRYDGLVEQLGGPATKGVGFALGMERLMSVLKAEDIFLEEENTVDVYIIPIGEEQKGHSLELCNDLRLSDFKTEVDLMNRNIKANFKQADRIKAKFIIIIGEDEIKEKVLTVKNNSTNEEFKIEEDYIMLFLQEHIDVEDK